MGHKGRLILIIEEPDEDEAVDAVKDFLVLSDAYMQRRIVVFRDAVALLESKRFLRELQRAREAGAEIVVVRESLEARGLKPPKYVKVESLDLALAAGDEDVVIRQGSTCPYSTRI